ncbi:DKNYY family protein, partial [Escherichia coli]|nr:DKNYY family protein [Escherichia coli]
HRALSEHKTLSISWSHYRWRDKNGFHRKVLDQYALDSNEEYSCGSFNVKEHRVTWRSSFPGKGAECQQEEIPGLDPEQFHPISDAVAQYQDKLYVIETTPFDELKLNIVTLDDPKLIINKRFNAGKRHGYLLTRKGDEFGDSGLQVFESAGPLILFDNHIPSEREAHQGSSNPYIQKWLARDDKYVYRFDGMQLWRYHTADPRAVRVVNDQLDGKINGDGEFIPTPRDEAKK